MHFHVRNTVSRHRRRGRRSRSLVTIDEGEELDNSGDSESSRDYGSYSESNSASTSINTRSYEDYRTIGQIGKAIATRIERQIITSKEKEERRQNEVEQMRLEIEGKLRLQMEEERIKAEVAKEQAEVAKKQAEEERKRIEFEIRQRIQLEARAEEEARNAEAKSKEETAKICYETLQQAVNEIAERTKQRILQDLKIASTQTAAAEEAQTKRHKYHAREEVYGTKRQDSEATAPPRSISDSCSATSSNLTVSSAQSAPNSLPSGRPHHSAPPPEAPEPPFQASSPAFASSASDIKEDIPHIIPSESSHIPDDETSLSSVAHYNHKEHAVPSITDTSGTSDSTYRARARAQQRFYEEEREEERQRQKMRVIREELVEPLAKSLLKLVQEARTPRWRRRVDSRSSDDVESDEEMWGDDESSTTSRIYPERARLRRTHSESWSSQTQSFKPNQSGGLTKWEDQRRHDDFPGLFQSRAPGQSDQQSHTSDVMNHVSKHRLFPVETQPLFKLPLEPPASRSSLLSLVALPLDLILEESEGNASRGSSRIEEKKVEVTIQASQEAEEEDVDEIVIGKKPNSVITQVLEKAVEDIGKLETSRGAANKAWGVIIQGTEKASADDINDHTFEKETATKVEDLIIQAATDTGEDDSEDNFEDALEKQTETI